MARKQNIKMLCGKLDRFIKLGESCGKRTNARKHWLSKAEEIREELLQIEKAPPTPEFLSFRYLNLATGTGGRTNRDSKSVSEPVSVIRANS